MKVKCFLAWLMLTAGVYGAPAYKARCDFQYPGTPLQDLTFLNSAEPMVQALVFEDGVTFTNIGSMSAIFSYGASGQATGFVYVTNQTSVADDGSFNIQFASSDTATNGTFWYTILFRESGNDYWSGSGSLQISNSTVIDASSLVLTSPIDWANKTYSSTDSAPAIPGTGITATTNASGQVTFNATAAGDFMADGSVPMTGNINMGGNSITNVKVNSIIFTDGEAFGSADSLLIDTAIQRDGSVAFTGDQSHGSNAVTGVEYLDMTSLGADPAHSAGRLFYSSTDDSWKAYFNSSDVAMNIGEETWLVGRNETGITITNGQVVYVSGQTGNKQVISLAKADAESTSHALAFATEDIAHNSTGKCTAFGSVGGLDTSGATAGAQIYLSPTTAGLWTTNEPTAETEYKVELGTVGVSHGVNGTINANIQHFITATDVFGLISTINGIVNTNDNIAFIDTANQFTEPQMVTNATAYMYLNPPAAGHSRYYLGTPNARWFIGGTGDADPHMRIKDASRNVNFMNFYTNGNMRADVDLGVKAATKIGNASGNTGVDGVHLQFDTTSIRTDGGDVYINESGGDYDFRVESDNDANALFVRGSDGNMGIGTSTPTQQLQVAGSVDISGTYKTNGVDLVFGGGLTYTDRGDPTAVDFSIGDFTTDNTWRDLDLAPIIGTNAAFVVITVRLNDNLAAQTFNVRENGNTNVWNAGTVSTIVANQTAYGNILVQADSNGVVEYRGANTTFAAINLTVMGWFK